MTAAYDPFVGMAHDPRDPDPWLALYLDQSLPIDPEAKRCLLVGARSEDVMRLTEFDEGPLPADWVGELEQRGIAVVRDLKRDEACAVLRSYGELGGTFY